MASRGGRGGAEKGGLPWGYLPVWLDPVSYLDDFKRHILPPTFPDWDPDIVEASPMDLGQLYMYIPTVYIGYRNQVVCQTRYIFPC